MRFALIPAGEFQMGSTSGDDDERPVHTVRISTPFYLGIHGVTQGQWEAVMGNNPSRFTGDPNRPVETVSWEEIQQFIDKLNSVSEAITGETSMAKPRGLQDGLSLIGSIQLFFTPLPPPILRRGGVRCVVYSAHSVLSSMW
jgi:hypothetical protein